MRALQQTGMVLLTTMMMIVILTLLVLSLMQSVLLYIKSSHPVMVNHQVLRQMEIIANTLDMANPACIIQDNNPNQLVSMLSANQGCVMTDGTRQYRYVLEDMGLYPCLQIMMNKTLQGSHHWFVTLVSVQPPAIALQLRFTKPEQTDKCELSMARQIQSGVVSWRKINVLLDRNKMHGKIFV